jgi:ABC-type branched-subunit amino acid transport system ATPase component
MAEAVLRTERLCKHFGGLAAVNDVSLEFFTDRIHAVIGPNGAGKTTLTSLLSGDLASTSGCIYLDGEDIAGLSADRISQRGVGRSYQKTNIFLPFTAFENCRLAAQSRLPSSMRFIRPARHYHEVSREAERALVEVGLEHRAQVPAATLSHGEQRQLEIAMTLATRPRILLLDEPLAGLAVAERRRIAALVKSVSAEIPVLFVEHDIDLVFQIADHVTVMNEGKVLVDGTVDDARSDAKVREVYIGSGSAALAAKPRATAAEPTPLLVVDKVDTFYGKSHILNAVSLDVHEHEIVALLGRNGAGKSTLLKTLVGIAAPEAGAITLAGEQTARLPSAEIARRGMGYVPQGRGLFAGMTVAENLALGRLKRLTGAGIHWDDDRIVAFFPRLAERWRMPADYLSGGEQQMVAVARALAGDVRVLLLDEPFEGLSPAVTEELFEAFDRLRHEIAMIIVDHHLDLALALSDRTVVLERGAVTWTGASQVLKDDLALRRKVLWM